MGWEYSTGDRGSEWHEGYLAAEFDDGRLALGIGGTGIPPGHLAVDRYGDGSFGEEAVRRHGGTPEFETRPVWRSDRLAGRLQLLSSRILDARGTMAQPTVLDSCGVTDQARPQYVSDLCGR